MRLFDFLHKYFGFNKRERNGIILLLGIVLVLLAARVLFNNETKPLSIELKKLKTIEKANFLPTNHDSVSTDSYGKPKTPISETKSELFSFDPNTIDQEGLQKLGLKPKLISTIINFRNKGGKFKTKEDLKKIYGLNEEAYTKLEPYILISTTANPVSENKLQVINASKNFILDLNNADSAQILKLPGIGPAFTRRILKFRNALGGFCNIQQLKEVYGMKDSTFLAIKDKIIINTANLKKININSATIEELKKHPYISHNVASTIVNFRSKHGLFKSKEQLLELGSISEENYAKLIPYIQL